MGKQPVKTMVLQMVPRAPVHQVLVEQHALSQVAMGRFSMAHDAQWLHYHLGRQPLLTPVQLGVRARADGLGQVAMSA